MTAAGATTESVVVNAAALEPLFETWEEPSAHRVRAERRGEPAKVIKGRRPSNIPIVNNIRNAVRDWREAFYAGASDTTRQLLNHWFERSHRRTTPAGEEFEFRYYFCQREAIETLVYLKEVRGIECLSQIIGEFGGPDSQIAALGVKDDEDAWSRYAAKLATGAGKTKVMSLAIVWSYFHALRESGSEMARHFVVIAPNLTVYERLKEDFGDGRIFDADPLIPPEWRGDWNMSVVLQDEASGAATAGTLYLTNIHRLYEKKKRTRGDAEEYDWTGPKVSKASAMDTGAALRDRITAHRRVMVLNDEAHHVWDPDSAWNDAIRFLHETIKSRTGGGLVAQLDFTATPKDDKGQMFKHIVCDTPLGEAVDAGIVKTPVIGQAGKKLIEQPSDDAAYRWEMHLRLGYERWKASRGEWDKSGKKPLLFVMCEDTDAADQIARRFNTDETFKELNGQTINLHTNLKGKLKKRKRGGRTEYEFVEDEKAISDEDLKALRELSRKLDENTSPYRCIISVLMLREGWDVRNVTTIVPLRPYTSKAGILPEQTLGRGLRRMTPPGQAHELVTVVEHPSFASLYQQELAQEGLPIEIVDVDRVPATTVSIYPDEGRKDVSALDIALPVLSAGHRMIPTLEGLSIDDVREGAKKLPSIPLPLGAKGDSEIDYEGKHMFTGEIIEKTKIHLPLLESGVGAVSYFVKQLEMICKLQGQHAVLAPLVETFLTEVLFEKKTDLFDSALVSRLGDSDVGEHIRAIFVPMIRVRTTSVEQRQAAGEPKRLSTWMPYQVTHSERRPALPASRTLFNLVPCNRTLEQGLTEFVDVADDVAAFAKNAGPQCLRIDYLASGGRLAFYTPDFFIRTKDGTHYLVETKGREDRDVPRKARAAMAWCATASQAGVKWRYLYVPQGVFERISGDTVGELARTCEPALQDLLRSEEDALAFPLFAAVTPEEERAPDVAGLVDVAVLESLPERYRTAAQDAAELFRFLEKKPKPNFAPVFTALLGSLDETAKGLIVRRLQPHLPATAAEQKAWFDPYFGKVQKRSASEYANVARNLRKTLVYGNGLSPIGLLRQCMDYALNDKTKIGGVFDAILLAFRVQGERKRLTLVEQINDFRNTFVAHQERELTDASRAERELKAWVEALKVIGEA